MRRKTLVQLTALEMPVNPEFVGYFQVSNTQQTVKVNAGVRWTEGCLKSPWLVWQCMNITWSSPWLGQGNIHSVEDSLALPTRGQKIKSHRDYFTLCSVFALAPQKVPRKKKNNTFFPLKTPHSLRHVSQFFSMFLISGKALKKVRFLLAQLACLSSSLISNLVRTHTQSHCPISDVTLE